MHCDGCLGSRRCWVCLGTGTLGLARLAGTVCHKCQGSGRCSYCDQTLAPTDVIALDSAERERAHIERALITHVAVDLSPDATHRS